MELFIYEFLIATNIEKQTTLIHWQTFRMSTTFLSNISCLIVLFELSWIMLTQFSVSKISTIHLFIYNLSQLPNRNVKPQCGITMWNHKSVFFASHNFFGKNNKSNCLVLTFHMKICGITCSMWNHIFEKLWKLF